MADRPPFRSVSSHDSEPYSDPFIDRPRQLQLQESDPQIYDSTTSISRDFSPGGNYSDDDVVEKLPLTSGNLAGGFYPPAYVLLYINFSLPLDIALAFI